MALTTLTKKEFRTYSDQVSSRSFMQSVQMGGLIRKKRGSNCLPCFETRRRNSSCSSGLQLAHARWSAYGAQFGAYLYSTRCSSSFYAELKEYAKQNGVLELLVKPYETYQTFDGEGNPIDAEKKVLFKI